MDELCAENLREKFANSDLYPIVLLENSNGIVPETQISSSENTIVSCEKEFFNFLIENKSLIFNELNVKINNNFILNASDEELSYKPTIAITNEESGIFLDIEIDIKYHDFYRFPMHYIGYDDYRDSFFTKSGWNVIRFTENQVHNQPEESAKFIANVICEIQGRSSEQTEIEQDKRWKIRDAVDAEKNLEREKLLGVQTFNKPEYIDNLVKSVAEYTEKRENEKCENRHFNITFDEETHTYRHENANYTSVTTLIEKFFPFFDEEAYIKHFMDENPDKTEADIRRKMAEPSELGTKMHQQIEFFLKGKEFQQFDEFELFKKFHEEQILKRNLTFFDAEKQISISKYNIAGTVDALFRKPDGTFVMVDWKRSKKLIIDKYPKKYDHKKGLSIMAHLDDSSYYHYELQQSFYKYILETEYNMKISSMILAVLHRDYDTYYTIKLSDYRKKEVMQMIAAQIENCR